MTIHATRAVLLRNLMRGGGRARIARLFDRLDPEDAARLFSELDGLELRRAACVLFDQVRASRSVALLPVATLVRLLSVATPTDAARAASAAEGRRLGELVAALPRELRARLLADLEGPARDRLVRCLPRSERPRPATRDLLPVLRLRRLFA